MVELDPGTRANGKTRRDPPKKKKRRKKRRFSLVNLVLMLVLLAGAGLVSYPTISDWWNSAQAYKTISNYSSQVQDMSDEEKAQIFAAAETYNTKRPNGTDFSLDDAAMEEYMSLLDVTGTGLMGHVDIPSIGVSLPVYHTVEEDVLQKAVGHVPGSSLPVGGERTHAALSGHRGLPSAKLFTDLNKLVEGDIFTLTVLDRVLTYQVDQIRIVLPEETKDLAIQPGRDFLTLITCTPYGVNSHRLLVRGVRIETMQEAVIIPRDASRMPGYTVVPFMGITIGIFVMSLFFIWRLISGKRRPKNGMLDDIRKNGIGRK